MSVFPSLIPSSRIFTPGVYPHTPYQAISGIEGRVRHSNVMLTATLRLTFISLTEANMLNILSHYNGQQGGFVAFTIPSQLLNGVSAAADYTLTGYLWRYVQPPIIDDIPCAGHSVELTLESVPPEAAALSGLVSIVQITLSAGTAAAANGIQKQVTISLAGGLAGAIGAELTISASVTGGTATGAAHVIGVEDTVAVTIGGGAAEGGVSGASYRYWQFDQITANVDTVLEIGEFALVNSGSYVSGGSWSRSDNNWATSTAVGSAPTDGVLTSRAFQLATATWPNRSIRYDHGSTVTATGLKYANYFRPASRYITGLRISGSSDGTSYTEITTLSGMTAYTAGDTTSWNELSPEYPF